MRISSLDDDHNDDSTGRRRHDSETSSFTSSDSESRSEAIVDEGATHGNGAIVRAVLNICTY